MSITTLSWNEALRAGRVWDWPDIIERQWTRVFTPPRRLYGCINGTAGRPESERRDRKDSVCAAWGKEGLVLVVVAWVYVPNLGEDGPGVI